MKSLLLGIVFIVLIGIGGLVYRNALEYAKRPIACPVATLTCPDGTRVAHEKDSCSFPACPPPNVLLPSIRVVFALPEGFAATALPDPASVAAYQAAGPTPEEPAQIIIRRYPIHASSTALATIEGTAIGSPSGLRVPKTSFSSTVLGAYPVTVVSIERFEAVIATAYYVARPTDVLRFDAIDRGVVNWMSAGLDVSTLPAHRALLGLLSTLQGE